MENLTQNFTLEEFVISESAERAGIDNTPDTDTRRNIEKLARRLEIVRTVLGSLPIHISSGYRCPALNKLIGGSETSMHMKGLAVDFICPKYGSPADVCIAIDRSAVKFDQLILEYGRWAHFGVSNGGEERRQTLTIRQGTGYVSGIHR